ncbi:MAG: hypothetical protein WCF36_01905 [Candidatus Nanopelagicales bacterium]
MDDATVGALIDGMVSIETPEGDAVIDETIAAVDSEGNVEVLAEEITVVVDEG